MLGNRTRRLVLALSLLAAVGAMLPGSHTAAAAPIPASLSDDVNFSAPPQADLQVLVRGKRTEGGVTKYFFTIKNNGPANAAPINAYKEAQAKAIIGSGFQLQDNGYFVIPSLAPGASKPITVSCTPPAGFVCKQATTLTLSNSYDPNDGNNMATVN